MSGLINRAPLWSLDNPIGTETTQQMGNPDPSFRPGVFAGGGKVPMSAEQIDAFREGSERTYDQLVAAVMGGEMPRGSAVPPRVAEPPPRGWATRRAEIITPNEQQPGGNTGLNAGLMSKRDFFDASNWRDRVTGRDRLIDDVTGRSGQTVDATGVYKNAADVVEHNDALVSPNRFDSLRGDAAGLDPRLKAAQSGIEAVRSVIDNQEGQGFHFVNTTAPSSVANSLKVTGIGGRVPTEAEMARLYALEDRYKMTLANSPDGVVFINDIAPGETGYRSGGAVEQELQAGFRKDIQNAFPGATVERGKYDGAYLYQGGETGHGQQGQGLAVRQLADRLEDMRVKTPQEYLRLIQSPAVQAKAQENIERLVLSGQINVRPDYVRMLNLVSGGRLEALLKHMLDQGSGGLP